MNNNPIISVVMPVYNGEKYLDESIQSILNQTYKDFELIIINDGSADNSLEIIEKYKQLDKRIVVISRENKGLIKSLNEAIEQSKGSYIARMDADDISLPTRFEEQLKFMKDEKLDMCGSWVEPFENDKSFDIWKYPENHNNISFRLFFVSSFAHPSVMFKSDVFKVLKYENEVAEDYRLWCDMVINGFKLGNIQKVLLKYRFHENQITQNKIEELISSSNKIRLNYAHNIKLVKDSFLVENSIEIQKNGAYKIFTKLLNSVNSISKIYNVTENNLNFIDKILYENLSNKNLLSYYLYYKMTKNTKRDMKQEWKFFIKSIMMLNRNSSIYQFLKRMKKSLEK